MCRIYREKKVNSGGSTIAKLAAIQKQKKFDWLYICFDAIFMAMLSSIWLPFDCLF